MSDKERRKQRIINDKNSDILHPNRANISKDELRAKLAELYKANKDQVNVFGLQTQFGGGKTTGFALIYDSPEALKKFEPHYRLVRVGFASKIEKPSRQQRMFFSHNLLLPGIFTLYRHNIWID
jgi:ribosomal protein S24E